MVKKGHKDHFFYKAKKNGHLARSYYKLQEADKKFGLIKPGLRVLDLGCFPGSWIEYCLKKMKGRGFIVGVDRVVPKFQFTEVELIQADIFEISPERLSRNNLLFDLVLSDMAPDTTGSAFVDGCRSFELSMKALTIADRLLNEGGRFFCKIFQGEDFKRFLTETKARFDHVAVFKPQSSKKDSREVYVVGLDKLVPKTVS